MEESKGKAEDQMVEAEKGRLKEEVGSISKDEVRKALKRMKNKKGSSS